MLDDYTHILKQNGLNNTRARRTVLEALITAKRALTMKELYSLCQDIDRVSVYRTIDCFESLRIIRKIQIGWKYKIELGDALSAHHHHMTCTLCGRQFDFDEPDQLDTLLATIARQNNFKITEHTLELKGTCALCTKRAPQLY